MSSGRRAAFGLVALLVLLVVFGAAAVGAFAIVGWIQANVHAPAPFFWVVYLNLVLDALTAATHLSGWLLKGIMAAEAQA